MNRSRLLISLFVGLLISAVAVYLAFRHVPLAELGAYLAGLNYALVLAACLLVVLSFALRALRWQWILKVSHPVDYWPSYHPVMIGFMLNCILPGRVGEVARPILLQRDRRVPFATGFATVVAERIFDVSMMMALFALALATVRIDPAFQIQFAGYTLTGKGLFAVGTALMRAGVLLLAGMCAMVYTPLRNALARLILAVPGWLLPCGSKLHRLVERRLARPLVALLHQAADGLALLRCPRTLAVCAGVTVLVWGVQIVSYWVMARASPAIDLTFAEVIAVLIIICMFIALPSVPGFWGIWEAGGVFALTLIGVAPGEAAGYTLANHAVQVFPVIFAGLASAAITGLDLQQAWSLNTAGTGPAK